MTSVLYVVIKLTLKVSFIMVAFLQSFDSMAWGYSEYFGSRDYYMRIVIVEQEKLGITLRKASH